MAVRTRANRREQVELPTGAEKTERVREMFDTIAPRYDLLNRIMSLGLDRGWRRATVGALRLPAGSVVLDLACGTGDLTALAQRAGYRTLGADLSWGMLAENRRGAPLVQGDAAALPFAGSCLDGIVCGYALRNVSDLGATLAEMARVLRPGGRLAVLEVAAPPPGLLQVGHRVWFERVVPLVGGALSDADAYRYLPRSTVYLPDEAHLRAMLLAAGFSGVGHRLLHGGLSQLVIATRAGLPPGASEGRGR